MTGDAPCYWEELDAPDEGLTPLGRNGRPVGTAYARGVAQQAGTEPLTGQQQRSLVSQDKILDAAVTALIECGYAGASTLKIQQLAGVSRGRLLHQFPNRDALLVAAVQHLAAARIAILEEQGPAWPEDLGDRSDAAVDQMWRNFQQDYFWAATELWLAARHNQDLRGALVPEERRLYRLIRGGCDRMFGPELAAREDYPFVRELLYTSMRGVALTYAFDSRRHARDPHVPAWKALSRTWLLAGGPVRERAEA